MKQNRFTNYIAPLIAIILTLTFCSCNDDIDGPKLKYEKMNLGRINLTGAKQLALKTGDATRAIDGEYLSAGLYKIDQNGNISAVAVYFTTDKKGNKLNKEYALKVAPYSFSKVSDNYAIAWWCEYYDADGDKVQDKWISDGEKDETRWIKQEVPYQHLLIRLSDGKIWCIDNVIDNLRIIDEGTYHEDSNNNLYWYLTKSQAYGEIDKVYKYNLESNPPSLEQIIEYMDDGSYGAYRSYGRNRDWNVLPNSVVWRRLTNTHEEYVEFAWPHSGFMILYDTDAAKLCGYGETLDLGYITENLSMGDVSNYLIVQVKNRLFLLNKRYISFKNGASYGNVPDGTEALLLKGVDWAYDNNVEIARLQEIQVGDNPGSIKALDNYLTQNLQGTIEHGEWEYDASSGRILMPDYWRSYKDSYFIVGNSIIISDGGATSKLSIIDLDKWEWRKLKDVHFYIDFDNADVFEGKIFVMNPINLGVHWFDTNTFEDGFTKFNVQLPPYLSRDPMDSLEDGFVDYSGRNPNTGKNERIRINILTGEASHETSEIDMFFQTIVSLN